MATATGRRSCAPSPTRSSTGRSPGPSAHSRAAGAVATGPHDRRRRARRRAVRPPGATSRRRVPPCGTGPSTRGRSRWAESVRARSSAAGGWILMPSRSPTTRQASTSSSCWSTSREVRKRRQSNTLAKASTRVLGGRRDLRLRRLDPGRLQHPAAAAVVDLGGRGAGDCARKVATGSAASSRSATGGCSDSVASSQRSRRSRITDWGRRASATRAPRSTDLMAASASPDDEPTDARHPAHPLRAGDRPLRPPVRGRVRPVRSRAWSASAWPGGRGERRSTSADGDDPRRSGSSSGAERLPLTRTSAAGGARSLIAACPRPGGRTRRRPPAGLVGAAFDHPAAVEHDDLVAVADRRQPVRDDEAGAAAAP